MYAYVYFHTQKMKHAAKIVNPTQTIFITYVPKTIIAHAKTDKYTGAFVFVQNNLIVRKTETRENHSKNTQRTGKKLENATTTNYYLVLLVAHFILNFCGFADASIVLLGEKHSGETASCAHHVQQDVVHSLSQCLDGHTMTLLGEQLCRAIVGDVST